MMMNNLNISQEKLSLLCKKYLIKELSLFGSALRIDFDEDSDIDLLVTFEDKTKYSLFDIVRVKEDFEKLFDRPVDIVNHKAIEKSKNSYRKKAILDTAKVIYAS